MTFRLWLIRFIFTSLCSLSAQALDLNGQWVGYGFVSNSFSEVSQDLEPFTLQISVTESELVINECMTSPQKKESCLVTTLKVDSSQRLYNQRGQQVGDLFPFGIQIYQGNRQVSELIRIQANENRQLRYTYSYMNFDGQARYRKADFKAK